MAVGSRPAGLFVALVLAETGGRVTPVEREQPVEGQGNRRSRQRQWRSHASPLVECGEQSMLWRGWWSSTWTLKFEC